MNYMSQIRAFYDVLSVKQLSAGQIALWHALMDKCNRLGWPEWFTVANITLESSCSLSRKGIYDSRNSLKQAGLIDFKSNGTKATSYRIALLYSTQDTTQTTTQDTTQATTQVTATLLKPKTNKRNKKDILTDIQREPEWDSFVSMRRQIKKPLTGRAVTMAVSKLESLAPGDLETQKKILDQSTYYCWQGLFPLKGNAPPLQVAAGGAVSNPFLREDI